MYDSATEVDQLITFESVFSETIQQSIEQQYDEYKDNLKKAGIISLYNPYFADRLAPGQVVSDETELYCVRGFNGQDYLMPTWTQMKDVFTHNHEVINRKWDQGFTKLQLTPVAASLATLIACTEDGIRNHAKFYQQETIDSPPIQISDNNINRERPVYQWDDLRKADVEGKLMYNPAHDNKHIYGGQTKGDVIADHDICALPGWSVGLIENMPFLPVAGQKNREPQEKGGRQQLSTDQSTLQYLEHHDNNQESGIFIEDALMHFLTHLIETNQITHDRYQFNALLCTGTFLPDAGQVPRVSWARDVGRLNVITGYPDSQYDGIGARPIVRLKA